MDFWCLTLVQCVFLALPQECVDMLVRKCSVHVGFIVPLWSSLSLKTRLGDSHHGTPKICTLRSCVWKAHSFLSSSDQKLQCTVSSLSGGMACVCGFEVVSSASATATLSATCLKWWLVHVSLIFLASSHCRCAPTLRPRHQSFFFFATSGQCLAFCLTNWRCPVFSCSLSIVYGVGLFVTF